MWTWSGFSLHRFIPGERHPVHEALVPMVVIDRIVLRAPIVPEGKRAGLPNEAAGELGSHLMREQIAEQRPALFLRPAFEVRRVADVHIKRLAPGLRMRAHDRMLPDQRLVVRARST